MAPLPVDLRNQLARAIQDARRDAEAGARKALESLAVDLAKAHDSMDKPARELRGRLRAHGKQLGDARDPNDTQLIDRLAHEVAYEHWHRMLFARFLAENHLLIEPSGQAISMEECEELARDQGVDPWSLAASYAQAMLPKIFHVDDPVLEVQLPPEARLSLERYLESLPAVVFTADDSLGWTYQFWQTEKERDVRRAGIKIGAEELPAVTQFFTEHYMVLFLIHNTIGAWRAGRILAASPDLANNAKDEDEVRRAVRLSEQGGYDFSYLRFVRERRAGDSEDAPAGPWRPAAGTFTGWPKNAAELRVLDPCCGSGHFLVEGFTLLVRLRMEEEGLSITGAIATVLSDNLFGLEIDTRCTQIAAFNLALAAWKLVGRPLALPPLNVSCAGLSVGGPREEWLELLGDRANSSVRFAFGQLYDLFSKAPSLGSLIDPSRFQGGAMLDPKGIGAIRSGLALAVSNGGSALAERSEMGVAAQGLAKATEVLGGRYTLVITNVPYLGRGKQGAILKKHLEDQFAMGKADLATAFVQRCLDFCAPNGTSALVTPENWWFQGSYAGLRRHLLVQCQLEIVAGLGEEAWESFGDRGPMAGLMVVTARQPEQSHEVSTVDAHSCATRLEKADELRRGIAVSALQESLYKNPDSRITLGRESSRTLLQSFANSYQGISPADTPRYGRCIWEVPRSKEWRFWQTTAKGSDPFGGRSLVLWWCDDLLKAADNGDAFIRGQRAWGREGVACRQMRNLTAAFYAGDLFDTNIAVIVPESRDDLAALWAYCSSPEFATAVRRIDKKVNVTNANFVKVPFDVDRWRGEASLRPGLPEPQSDDPTQWLFHGRPEQSSAALQVVVARLLGHRWPAELESAIRLSDRARALVSKCEELLSYADDDGIVCIPSVRGERPAADRVLATLSACGLKPDRNLDDWLRNEFFEEHCRLFSHLFDQRPFIWHIWDGRPDGFHALVNSHRLMGPKGEGRRTLQALTFSYLGDWIDRQRADQRDGKEGADARLAAALDLQTQLEKILTGEPPYDIFVRWKPLSQQPIGWDPDINDGVRLNIRPFMSVELRKGGRAGAGILRWKPNINWKKDRGTEPQGSRPVSDYPWFWGCPGEGSIDERTNFKGGTDYDGCRWNDLHYSNAAKKSARDSPRGGGEK